MLTNSLSNSVFGLVLVWLVCVIGVDWAVAQGSGDATEKRPPNIVLIMADDLGYNELGCYGQKWIKTPNIDSIAAHGMRFTQHYSGQAVCAPSRCSLLTGFHQGHAFIRGNGNPKARRGKGKAKDLYFPGQHPIPDETVTLFELLKQRGYATGAMGKWGLGSKDHRGILPIKVSICFTAICARCTRTTTIPGFYGEMTRKKSCRETKGS